MMKWAGSSLTGEDGRELWGHVQRGFERHMSRTIGAGNHGGWAKLYRTGQRARRPDCLESTLFESCGQRGGGV
ncbi:unnamed protein product [Protopolystoma xenopodis]|uniref:Uncharacterized protein n=1 Tax=Protopolystoma xenopodis TaxID=117903 RepID=A0A3S5A0B9_9PLAT|nr:unnamed protein product [Protopolystoma xenopodis]